jgi:integrase
MTGFRRPQADLAAAQRATLDQPKGTLGDAVAEFLRSEEGRRKKDFTNVLRGHWTPLFRDRSPYTIQADEVASALMVMRRSCEAATCNKRRGLLSAFWNRQLSAVPNPVLAKRAGRLVVQPFKTPTPTTRAIPLDLLRNVFGAMRESKTKARLMLIFYTACRHSELKRVRPEHLHVDDPHPKLGPFVELLTGKGGVARNVGLVGEGLEAARLFCRLDAFGAFSNSSVWKAFRRAAINAKVEAFLHEGVRTNGRIRWRLRPYDLRHTCLTHVRQVSDIATAQKMAGHTNIRTTLRYAPTEDEQVFAAQLASKASALSLHGPASGGAAAGA